MNREFFTARTVAEASAGFRPARRTAVETVGLAEGTDLLAASTNVLRFFRDESCGKCVPCRVGSTKAHTILRDVVESGSELDDDRRAHVLRLEEVMRKTSICGLGQVALGPVVSVLGLDKGGAAAREQPRPNGAADQPDR